MPGPYIAFQRSWRISALNVHARTMLGLSPGEGPGAHLLDILRDRLDAAVALAFQTTLDRQTAQRLEVFARPHAKWFEVIAFPTPEGVASCWRDVTARRQAENQLQESHENLRAVFDSMTEAFFLAEIVYDSQGKAVDFRYLAVNSAIEHNTGLKPDMFPGKSGREVLGSLSPYSLEEYRKVAETGAPSRFEYYSPGLGRFFEVRAFSPALGRFAALLLDITGRKRAEEKLAHQADLLELSFDAIIAWRLRGGIESWNRGAEQMYGYSKEEAQGRVTHELLRTVHPVAWEQIEADLIEHGEWNGELSHRAKDGRELVVSTRMQIVRGTDGVPRVLEINRDITAHKMAELAEKELNRELAWTVKELKESLAQAKESLAKAKALRGLIPICASCKKVRNDEGYWQQVEVYVRDHSEADFSHGICPECAAKLYPDFAAPPAGPAAS